MAANTPGAGPVPLTNGQITSGLWDSDVYYLVAGQFTYSVPDATSSWNGYGSGDEPYTGYVPFDAQQSAQFRAAMAVWDSYIAPSFSQTDDHTNTGFIRAAFTTAAQDDDEFAAYAYTGGPAGRQSPVAGDIWINTTYNKPAETTFAVGTYDWQTLLHEIGHTIGLKHPFEEPQVPADYDDRRYTIMSYTDYQDEYVVTFTTSGRSIQGHYTAVEASTPMVLDIAAVQARYGADPNTATGNDVYRFDQNQAFMRSIYDAGGRDTIDISNFTRGSIVDLRPGAYSSIGYWSRADQEAYWIDQLGAQATSYVQQVFDDETYVWSNNLGLSFSTTIEDAVGGSGADVLIGNAVANALTGGAGDDILTGGAGADVLTGGIGTDTFRDAAAGFAGDTITDFRAGETINVTDASQTGFAYHRQGSTFDLGGGSSLSVAGGITGYLVTRASAAGGVDLTLKASPAGLNDFNGDGHSDILWQNRASGDFSAWQVTGNLSATQVQQNSYYHGNVGGGWQIEGTIDYNGDGASDVLWHNTLSGSISLWNASGSGGFTPGSYTSNGVDVSWNVAALGDFTGDGKEEILWRNANGAVSEWQSSGSGFTANTFYADVDRSWHIQGTGDFDGDGKADIFWRNANGAIAVWDSTGSGMNTNSYYHGAIATSWHMTGIGDFDGDGRSDILWRNDDGSLSIWRSTGTAFTESVYNTSVPTAWHVVDVADYNGDGRDDILWRNDDGGLSIWRSTGGDFDKGVYNVGIGTEWQTLSHHYDII